MGGHCTSCLTRFGQVDALRREGLTFSTDGRLIVENVEACKWSWLRLVLHSCWMVWRYT